MANIAPVPVEAIEDAELRQLIERCQRLGVPDTLFPRILAHVPHYAKALLHAMLQSHADGSVDHKLKEIVRVRLAEIAGDGYFSALRSNAALAAGLTERDIEAARAAEASARFSAAERCALRYAENMYRAPDQVDAAFYAEMKRHFSEAQIMELGAFIAFHYGMQVFMRTLEARPLAQHSGSP